MMTPTVAELRERVERRMAGLVSEDAMPALDALCALASQSHSEGYRAGVEAAAKEVEKRVDWLHQQIPHEIVVCASAIRSLPVPSDREKKRWMNE